jgi:hypothetical protein
VPPAFCGLHMTNVYPQLAPGHLVMHPLAFLKTNELSILTAGLAHGPDMTEKDASSADECSTECSAASMPESDTGDAFYEVKNTFVHIPNIQSVDRRLKASRFLSERCHRRATEA